MKYIHHQKHFLLVAASLSCVALTSQAATIAWTSGTITGDSIVETTGTVVEAANFGGGNVTINGVSFLGVNLASGGTLTNMTELQNAYNTTSGSAPTPSLGNIDTLLSTINYQSGVSQHTVSLTGLTAGTNYVLQFFVYHEGTATSRGNLMSDGNGTASQNFVATVSHNKGYGTGTFTADGISQSLTFKNDSNGSQLWSGYQLRAVPEPSTLLFVGLVGLGLFVRRRR